MYNVVPCGTIDESLVCDNCGEAYCYGCAFRTDVCDDCCENAELDRLIIELPDAIAGIPIKPVDNFTHTG